MTDGEWVSRATRHARLRWIGVALFGLAAVLGALSLVQIGTGRAPFSRMPLVVFSLGLSLGAFGVNNDTALHAMHQVPPDALPDALRAERADEARRRPGRNLHAAPRMGWLVPLAALAVMVVHAWRAIGAAG